MEVLATLNNFFGKIGATTPTTAVFKYYQITDQRMMLMQSYT